MTSLREGNRKRVIDALRERGHASRAELARITDLSRSTISTIVGRPGRGRPRLRARRRSRRRARPAPGARRCSFRSTTPPASRVGIDFGHRHLRVAVSDLSHTVLAETWRELNVDHSAAHGLDAAADFVDQVLEEAGVERSRVIGVGMGLPAPIDRSTGAVQGNSILPGWVGVDAAAEASRRLGMPVGGRKRRQPRRPRRARVGRRGAAAPRSPT